VRRRKPREATCFLLKSSGRSARRCEESKLKQKVVGFQTEDADARVKKGSRHKEFGVPKEAQKG